MREQSEPCPRPTEGSSVHRALAQSQDSSPSCVSAYHVRRSASLSFSFLIFKMGLKPPIRAFRMAQLVKNLPAVQETLVQFLGWEDPLEKR